jgi:hypothetical protein
MKEQWRPVREFEGVYEVSDLGNVRRIASACGATVGKILKPFVNSKGYVRVNLYRDHRGISTFVHRLVAEVFIPNPLNLPEVNHLGPQDDCRASKLEWRSVAGNNLYRQQHDNKGVRFARGKWIAHYCPAPNKFKWLGTFDTEKEARAARKKAVDSIPYVL